MVPFQSLYRKYRPQRFGEMVGQEHVTTALRNAVREGRVGHAYLFSGPRGTGKTTTARILAKALNCLALGDDGEPCGDCENCVAIAAGRFGDLVELDAASNNGVDAIRELIDRVHLGVGATTTRKVYLVDEVHMLSTAASNALLKTLEEPPEHVVFVLATTDPQKVLPTIRSRTQHFEVTLLTVEQLVSILAEVLEREGVDAAPDAVAYVARRAAGSARDALSALDQALALGTGRLELVTVSEAFGAAPFEARATVLDALVSEDVPGVLAGVAALLEAGRDPRRLADELLRALRDAFLLTSGGGRVRVDAPDEERAHLRSVGAALGGTGLVRALETLGQAVVDMRGTEAADPRLVLEIALLRVTRRDAGPPLQVLADRVERVERTLEELRGSPASGVSERAAGSTAHAPSNPSRRPALGAIRRRAGEASSGASPREAGAAPPGSHEAPAADDGAALDVRAPVERRSPSASIDLDDVILAWAEVLPDLSVVTRSAVQEAQPIAVEGDVVVFGVPSRVLEAARARFQRDVAVIRDALATRLGAGSRFKLVPYDEFGTGPIGGAGSSRAPRSTRASSPRAEASRGAIVEESIDLTELSDAGAIGAGVDSLARLRDMFGATVVEELPRQ